MNIFEEIKKLVDVPTAARHYGLEVHGNNMAICPFHRDLSPSCKLYENNYHCFGCQAHGDVIKLVQDLFGLSAIDAAKQINSDFNLGLDMDKPIDTKAIAERRKEAEQRKAKKEKEDRMYYVLLCYFILLDKYKIRYAPKDHDDVPDKRFLYALENTEIVGFLLEHFDQLKEYEGIEKTVDIYEQEYKRIYDLWEE